MRILFDTIFFLLFNWSVEEINEFGRVFIFLAKWACYHKNNAQFPMHIWFKWLNRSWYGWQMQTTTFERTVCAFGLRRDLSKCQIERSNMKVWQCLHEKGEKKSTTNYIRKNSILSTAHTGMKKKYCSASNRVTGNTINEYILALATCFNCPLFIFFSSCFTSISSTLIRSYKFVP